MKVKHALLTGLMTAMLTPVAIAATAPAAGNPTAGTMNAEQTKNIETIVHNYILSHPEILVEASKELQKREMAAAQAQAKSAIEHNAPQLLSEKFAIAGNPKGRVTLVEFFDFQCGHCIKMGPVVSALIKKNDQLRVIYKNFPIFGKNSEVAARGAVAAAKQGKYEAMQTALLQVNKPLDEAVVLEAAKSIGLNVEQLKKDMDSEEVTKSLAENRDLAEKMRLMGTPAFIVLSTNPQGEVNQSQQPTFIPGSTSEQALQALIDKA